MEARSGYSDSVERIHYSHMTEPGAPRAAETILIPSGSSQLWTNERPGSRSRDQPISSHLSAVLPTVKFLSRLAHTTWMADPFRSRQATPDL